MLHEHSGIVRDLDSFTVAEAAPGLSVKCAHRLPCFTLLNDRGRGHLKQSAKVRGLTPERQSKRHAMQQLSERLNPPLSHVSIPVHAFA
jgi:hypothetical protein